MHFSENLKFKNINAKPNRLALHYIRSKYWDPQLFLNSRIHKEFDITLYQEIFLEHDITY